MDKFCCGMIIAGLSALAIIFGCMAISNGRQVNINYKAYNQLKQEAIDHGYAVEDDGVFRWREK